MLTWSGVGLAASSIVLAALGLAWGYEELVVVALAAIALVVMALWEARRSFRTTVRRQVTSPRVERGDPIRLSYRASNDTRFRSSSATIVDRCGGATTSVDLPPLPSGKSVDRTGTLATSRRGIFDVGPWAIERTDPFGLAIGRREADERSRVTVHPKIYTLIGPHGAVHTIDSEAVVRRPNADPMAGFVSLREYARGDDPRLIHWPTTARMGELMVREHVEVRRPEFTVVLDTAAATGSADDFEEAVDVAASVAIHAVRSSLDVVVRTTSRAQPGTTTPLQTEEQVLDLLTVVERSGPDDVADLSALFTGRLRASSVIVITGPQGPSGQHAHVEQVSTVRVGEGAVRRPGVVLAVADASEFARRWQPWR